MQPILAESGPHRSRAIAIALVLAIVAAFAAMQTRRGSPRHRHHHYELQQRIGKCAQVHYSSYVYTR
ncbi:MAG TPA: hypothetical protein VGD80_25840 [Kofleriaceae bacterium]